MNRLLLATAACAAAIAVPGAGYAQRTVPAPQRASRAVPARAPAVHPAPAMHPIPAVQRRPATNGFSFPHETNVRPPVVNRPAVPARPGYRAAPQRSFDRSFAPHVPYRSGPYTTWRGPVIPNRHRWGNWRWNRGIVWYPVPYYWGGGFWGPWATGFSGLVLFGSIADYSSYTIYPSYEVEQTSPGAELLSDYQLTQTQCGPPNLVVIWGPDNSVVCAYPNDMVAPGNYELDPATLTLQSLGTSRNP